MRARKAKITKDGWDRSSYQNLSNYYWHQSAKYTGCIWQDIEEMWLFGQQQLPSESELKDFEL